MRILVDKILHAFESNGNIHLVFGIATGQVDGKGVDLREPVVTIIVPSSCATKISEELNIAVTELSKNCLVETGAPRSQVVQGNEFLGAGVRVAIP